MPAKLREKRHPFLAATVSRPTAAARGERGAPRSASRPRWRTIATMPAFQEARFLVGLLAVYMLSLATTFLLAAVVAAVVPGWSPVVMTSDSMAPSIRRGDVVVTKAFDGGELVPGNVVTFDDPAGAGLITHRIISVDASGAYQTKGDANPNADSTPVTADQIRGTGRFLVTLVGLPAVWLASGAWLAVAVTMAAATATLWLLRYGMLDEYAPRR